MEEKRLTDEEKIQLARESREFFWKKREYANDRENKINDALRSLEMQIATIIFALSGIFPQGVLGEKTPIVMLVLLSGGLLALALSIGFGLINEFLKRRFWKDETKIFNKSFEAFNTVLQKESTLEEALAFQKGLVGGDTRRASSPDVPLILQTVLLVVGGLAVLGVRLLLLWW